MRWLKWSCGQGKSPPSEPTTRPGRQHRTRDKTALNNVALLLYRATYLADCRVLWHIPAMNENNSKSGPAVDMSMGSLTVWGGEEQYLLDAGCGTGSYMSAYVRRVGKIECMDFNNGILDRVHGF